MKIILTNGTELTPIMVTGENKYIQNANRDTLTFVFIETSLDEIDSLFTESNCEIIKIVEDEENIYVHSAYTIKTELVKKQVEIQAATTETEAVTEQRVFVTMAQRTYAETQIASLTETVDILVLENLLAE